MDIENSKKQFSILGMKVMLVYVWINFLGLEFVEFLKWKAKENILWLFCSVSSELYGVDFNSIFTS